MSLRPRQPKGRSLVLLLSCGLASLSAGYLCVGLLSAGEWAPGALVGSFALLVGALALASARRPDPPAPPVRFVPHARLMAMLALAAVAILAALLLPMPGR